jgi:hypothetical protein
LEEACNDFAKVQAKYEKSLEVYERKLATWTANQEKVVATSSASREKRKTTNEDPKPVHPQQPHLRMQAEEPRNFLRFATSLKLFIGRRVTDDMLIRAASLLHAYLEEFKRVRCHLLLIYSHALIASSYMV